MKIIKSTDVAHVNKPEGTSVYYYLFNDYEVHYNDQAPKTTQTWHHHEKIRETLYIIDGELTVKWRDGDQEFSKNVSSGDLIETERTAHTLVNDSDNIARFIVIKRIPSSDDFREIFKTDKIID